MGANPIELLGSTSLFSKCAECDLCRIAELSDFVEIPDGSYVFKTGDASERFYIVESGEVVIRKPDDEGRMVDIARFLPGDCFGELDMFTREDRNADALAVGDGRLLAFPGLDTPYDSLSISHPGVTARLLNTFLVQISNRIRGINSLVKENSPVVQELKRQVYVDKLTGLYNKTFFAETLERIVSRADGPIGLVMYKPDNFKTINDSCGHEAGDKVLRYIADSLTDFVPEKEHLFRYAGNENAIILPGVDRSAIRRFADDLGNFLRGLPLAPVIGDTDIVLSISIGMALTPEHATSAEDLIEITHPLPLEGRRMGGNLCLFPEDVEKS